MQVTVEDVSTLTKKMKVVLPGDMVTKKIEDAYHKLNSEISLKGFRKGKIPRKVLEKNYNEKIKQDVGDKLVQDTYFDALEQAKLDAVVHPEIRSHTYEDDGTFMYEAEVDVRPVFELAGYKGIELEHPEVVVGDEEVQDAIEKIRRQNAPLRTVEDRGAQEGDVVVINFKGYHDGNPMDKVGGDNYSIDVGTGRNGKEFEEMVIGAKKGESLSKNIDFPTAFPNPILAGLNVEFKIDVKDVKERILPELDDEFAKDMDEEFKTIDDLKNNVRDLLQKDRERKQDGDINDKIMYKLIESHDFEAPDKLVAYEINRLIEDLEGKLKQQGLTLESAGMKTEDLTKQYKDAAVRRVKGDFLLKEIAKKENLKIDDEDISQGFQRIADQYGMTVEEVKPYFRRREELLPFMNELLNEKILKFLRDEAKISFVKTGATE